jgi:hypothetical protein
MCFTTAQDVELNRHSEYRREIHGNDTDKKEVSGNHPPGRPEKKDAENEQPLRINPEGLLVNPEGIVIGPIVEGSYYMPARVPR